MGIRRHATVADTRPSIARYLRERREAAGLTQPAMAVKTRIPLPVIRDFERGVVAPLVPID
jgi:cytoskeletal protein RodZ